MLPRSSQVRSFRGFKLILRCILDLEDVISCTSLHLTRPVAFAPSDASSSLSGKLQFLPLHMDHMCAKLVCIVSQINTFTVVSERNLGITSGSWVLSAHGALSHADRAVYNPYSLGGGLIFKIPPFSQGVVCSPVFYPSSQPRPWLRPTSRRPTSTNWWKI